MVNDAAWFVAGDLAKALDYTRTDAMLQHCEEHAVLPQLNNINNLPPATKWINEVDLYSCIFGSTKPKVEMLLI